MEAKQDEREFYAHSRADRPITEWHKLEDHLRATAELARKFAGPFGAGDWAYLAGLWHDLGKYSPEFQAHLLTENGYEAHLETQPGRVEHSILGAHTAIRAFGDKFGKLLSYALAGHHAGLPDAIGGQSALESRLRSAAAPGFQGADHLAQARRPLGFPFTPRMTPEGRAFQAALLIRMIFSALVDADFLDTEAFMDEPRARNRIAGMETVPDLASRLSKYLDGVRGRSPDTDVNRWRRKVLANCLESAGRAPGLFSLTVPTGGGKTLSSLAFALNHAAAHGLRRVIYAVPFTSIIEQNAQVFRDAVGAENVLEHHSNLDPLKETVWTRLTSENWDSPIIVTTNVQFFESFFASRTSACRKLHNVARSVVILDEAQALPIQYLHPCLELLRELAGSYGCSVVLCTATQPAIEWREDFAVGLRDVTPIVKDVPGLFVALRRVRVEKRGLVEDADLAAELMGHRQVLCVVNTRKHAKALFDRLGRAEGHVHLSALMCPAHRSAKLLEIRERLARAGICRVVSTQLVEAGVDLDFPVVYRAMAGLDAIAQASGRCNREGRLPEGKAVVFEPEVTVPAGHLRHTAQAAAEIAPNFHDLLAPPAVEAYFRLLYWQRSHEWDRAAIMTRLAEGLAGLSFPFRSIAQDFQFIRDGMEPVIIPWDNIAEQAIRDLRYSPVPPAGTDRRLQRYVVAVPSRVRNQLPLEVLHDRFCVLADMRRYSSETGLQADPDSPMWTVESLMA